MVKKKSKVYKSSDEVLKDLIKKNQQKTFKSQAKVRFEQLKRTQLQQISYQQQQASKRQRIIGILGSKAEQLEIEAVSLNETPFLFKVENQRSRACTPPDKFIINTEREVTDSFPQ